MRKEIDIELSKELSTKVPNLEKVVSLIEAHNILVQKSMKGKV